MGNYMAWLVNLCTSNIILKFSFIYRGKSFLLNPKSDKLLGIFTKTALWFVYIYWSKVKAVQTNFCFLDCGFPGIFINGVVSRPNGTLYGTNATYTCNVGYTLEGSDTRTCEPAGIWMPKAPVCRLVGVYEITTRINICSRIVAHSGDC